MKLEGPHMYELFSIIVHSGTPINGHYYACIRDFRSGNWLSFNDHIVTPITHDKITETYGNGISTANAYVVTYRQIDRERNALPIESSQFPPHIKELLSEENTKAEQPVKFDPENHSSIAGSFWGSTCKTHDNLSLQYPLNDIEHECISANYVDLLPPSIAMKVCDV
ncbi:ubiquitin carboxyl-terminal hydrolase 47-like [Nasonia vitripennis]|uniref:ubiquitinyl hydrolase 1 n=1 Tax=Nasonia vitripennis TaxID=7425 RepID=A0A7M7T627_NASVI|nr:ubiquitin carboxyl-terminal hydrolase 47-like [Nasonia vitripennis]